MGGCLKAIGFLGLTGIAISTFLVGSCVYEGYQIIKSIPPSAKREVLYPRYRSLIDDVEKGIRGASTLAAASQAFSGRTTPTEVLLISTELKNSTVGSSSKGKLNFVSRGTWFGNSYLAINGAGYGSLSGFGGATPVFVISNSANLASGQEVSYLIFIRDFDQFGTATAIPASP